MIKNIILILILFNLLNLPVLSEQNMVSDEDTIHSVILKPGTTVTEKPEDMFKRNCSDCHVGNIIYSLMYSILLNDTIQSKEKMIHSWLTCATNDSLKEIQVRAEYINSFNDTLPIKKAMVLVMVKRYFGWMSVHSQPFLTGDSGIAIFRFPDGVIGDTAGFLRLLIRLADQTSCPNAKLKINKNWATPISKELFSNTGKTFLGFNPLYPLISVVFILGTLTICIFLGYILFLIMKIKKAG
jgi:hypothetical protein